MQVVRQQPMVTVAASLHLIQRAIAGGATRDVAISVTVVDPSMALIAFAKADGATAHSAETSRRKANTAASTRRATGWMDAALAAAIPPATGGALTNIAGGEPLVVDRQVIGGLGIAGGTPAQDAEIAEATVAGFGTDRG